MRKGTIGVTTDNIFPVIKKFLYSDHEIFLREMVSNAVDATQKLKALSSIGEFKGETGALDVRVSIDKDAGTLTISDRGIGMTAEDIDKYINQIAFSGAEEFLKKYKDSAATIIGHFGLGFYSAFMVSKKVAIVSLSYKEGAKAVRWECDGSPEYTMAEADKADRGTDIILYIDDDDKEFLEQPRVDALLKKYCRFLPIPVIFGKEQERKDGKMTDTDRDHVVNNTEPSWIKKPSELTDKDYLAFYHELYPGQDDPLFWIHLNVDYPFTLTGILFFPKIKNNFEVTKNRIQLYCNQVYVTDSVEGVVPDFMMLLQGVIDSPDIPLNVSRSYLQADAAVKKISTYITKKVSSRLDEIFRKNRADFEKKWDDVRIFIQYGMLTDEKFCEAALKFCLLKDTEGKYFTLDEYKTLVQPVQTDKNGDTVYLYTSDTEKQYTYIKAAKDKGYSVIVLDGQLDSHFVGLLENKFEKTRLVRVDSDIVENLIPKDDHKETGLTDAQRDVLTAMFRSQLPQDDKTNYLVSFEALSSQSTPIVLTQNEYMRRMKDMAALQPGMSFYGELPDSYSVVINTANPVVERIAKEADAALGEKTAPLVQKIAEDEKALSELRKDNKDDKDTHEKTAGLEASLKASRDERDKLAGEYAGTQPVVKQLVDLALLGNGMLKGEALNDFISRSLSML